MRKLAATTAGLIAISSLTGCGISYPNSQELRDFKEHAAEFCGDDNYAGLDVSNRPFGGPDQLTYAVTCLNPPVVTSDYGQRWKEISGDHLVLDEYGNWRTQDDKHGEVSYSIYPKPVFPAGHPRYAAEQLGQGPMLTIDYFDLNSYS